MMPVVVDKYAPQKRWRLRNLEKDTADSRIRSARWRRENPARAAQANKDRRNAHQQKINAIKLASGCVDCGYNLHAEALEFDHLPEFQKLFQIGGATMRSWKSIEAEIAKCEVVCANCHVVRTATRGWQNQWS